MQVGRGGFAKQSETEIVMKQHMEDLKTRTEDPIKPLAPARTLGAWLTEWLKMYAADKCRPKRVPDPRGPPSRAESAGKSGRNIQVGSEQWKSFGV